ncbi:MAG: ribosome maturation factor RimP [Alphaproteobacteria bacterium]|nr:ribosome maturation factor RimP [Alphaproteobacteria bacterium]
MTTTKAKELHELLAPSLASMGYDLVQVRLLTSGRPTLQVLAEPACGGSMSLDDCSMVSRHISAVLDVEDPIAGAYNLEVGSPGIDRPLVKAADYERFQGEQAKIETTAMLDGRKRFRGVLDGVADGAVRIRVEDGDAHTTCAIPLDQIASAKLVLTDDLIARDALRRGKGRDKGDGASDTRRASGNKAR